MEKVTKLVCLRYTLLLETDAKSALIVFPGGAIVLVGFLDVPSYDLTDFSHRLYHRNGVLIHELNDHRGRIVQRPLARVEDSPSLRDWLAAAERIIP